ncbi:MAG: type II secretion system F family protein [Oscillospiraceae bacterium]|nr:type II secretion system F family protein [Oscillospiraceae bacterium]
MNVSAAMKNLGTSWLTKLKSVKIKPCTLFLIKTIWVYPFFVAGLYMASSLFISSPEIRLIISVILGIFPWKEAMKKLFSNGYRHTRTQLLVMLQVLCTSVSSGYSIEKSLLMMRPVIEHTFGRRCMLIKPLINLENDLKLHISLEKALNSFAEAVRFPETVPIFHALAISGEIGNNSLAILRSSCQMLSEMNAVQSEIHAQNAGKNAEAAMLCAMPFAVTFALNFMSRDYIDMARNTNLGSVLLAIAFAICVIACAMLLRYMSHDSGRKIRASASLGYDDSLKVSPKYPLTSFFRRIFPTGFITSRHELFNELSVNPRLAYEQYLKKQILICAASGFIGLTVSIKIGKNPCLAVPFIVLMAVLGSREVRSEVERKREDLMTDIPLFMCLMSTLLEAGMQLPKAIEICAKAFGDNKSLSLEIKNLRAMMLSGISASEAVERFSLRIQIPEAQSALLLVARYDRLGTAEVLNLLQLQASSCWNLCRNAARKKQEREALGLLLPMTLDFVSVLMVAMTPAIISLGI